MSESIEHIMHALTIIEEDEISHVSLRESKEKINRRYRLARHTNNKGVSVSNYIRVCHIMVPEHNKRDYSVCTIPKCMYVVLDPVTMSSICMLKCNNKIVSL